MISGNHNFITKEQASFTELIENQESIILDLESLYYFSLNAAATLIWKHLRSGSANNVEDLSQAVAKTFGIAVTSAAADVRDFLSQLTENHLITTCEGEVTGLTRFTMPESLSDYSAPALKMAANIAHQMNLASGSSSGGSLALGGGS